MRSSSGQGARATAAFERHRRGSGCVYKGNCLSLSGEATSASCPALPFPLGRTPLYSGSYPCAWVLGHCSPLLKTARSYSKAKRLCGPGHWGSQEKGPKMKHRTTSEKREWRRRGGGEKEKRGNRNGHEARERQRAHVPNTQHLGLWFSRQSS